MVRTQNVRFHEFHVGFPTDDNIKNSGGTNSKISNFKHSNSGIFELRTQRTLAQKSMSNSNLDSRTSNFRKNKMT